MIKKQLFSFLDAQLFTPAEVKDGDYIMDKIHDFLEEVDIEPNELNLDFLVIQYQQYFLAKNF